MIAHVARAGQPCGLKMHPEKTKILTNLKWRRGEHKQSHIVIDGMNVELLKREGATKYLVRKISFHAPHRTEVENRMASAWRKFAVQKMS